MLSFSKEPENLKRVADSAGAVVGTPAQAVDFADVAALATPWTATPEALRQVGRVAQTRVVWDCTNALKPDMSGLAIGTTTSGGEEIARLAPWAKVVKAISPFAEVLHSPSTLIGGMRPTVFVCGDDSEACAAVAGLVEDIGAAPLIAGPLLLARYTEPAAMLLLQLAYMQGFGARIGLALVQETGASAGQ
jgi:predicted dinucleotide-binding enzyme